MTISEKLEMQRILISSNISDANITRFDELLDLALNESYEEGYAQGTLSVRQEMIQHDEAYEKGRADAIEEFLKKDKECQ